jgi:hypothetical protein
METFGVMVMSTADQTRLPADAATNADTQRGNSKAESEVPPAGY